MVVDSHTHFDERIDGTIRGAVQALVAQIEEGEIDRVVALHLETQPWSPAQVSDAVGRYSRIATFVNVHPDSKNAEKELENAIRNLGFIGLKLHPRLQNFQVDSESVVRLVNFAGELGVPVLIDAFPDGTHLMQGFNPMRYASLAQKTKNTRTIWAHMGGHHVLDFMMLAKRLPNVFMDTSYSLLYYRDSAVTKNIVYAMKSMKYEKIFYGSDYPDRPLNESLKLSIQELRNQGLNDETMLKKILWKNANDFFFNGDEVDT
jgi:predicted TIM-barrel fold metal-dependent hydrolase